MFKENVTLVLRERERETETERGRVGQRETEREKDLCYTLGLLANAFIDGYNFDKMSNVMYPNIKIINIKANIVVVLMKTS